MPRRKTGLTMDRHREIAHDLRVIREVLQDLGGELCRAYPLTDGYNHVQNALNALSKLRSRLEDKMFSQHGSAGDLSIYYGHEPLDLVAEMDRLASEAWVRDGGDDGQ